MISRIPKVLLRDNEEAEAEEEGEGSEADLTAAIRIKRA
jgi:hypothetical protein